MPDLALGDRVLECANDVVLPDQVVESLASVLAVKGDVGQKLEVTSRNGRDGGAGNDASPRAAAYRCCLPALAGFTVLLPRSSRRDALS